MNYTKLGIAACASSLLSLGGCGILDTVDLPNIRFDSNTYIVQPGDTLESVADRYDVDPNALVSVNALQVAQLVPGQRLLLVREGAGATAAINRPLADGDQVVLVPAASQSQSGQTLNTQPIGPDSVVVEKAIPSEKVIGVRDSNEDDALLGSNEPIFVPDLPTLPAPDAVSELPTLSDAPVIKDDIRVDLPVAMVERPEGAETIIGQGGEDMPITKIPMADSDSQVAVGNDADNSARQVVVNTRVDGWNWPALGEITREFDLQEINRQGLDIKAGPGAGVQAAADGEVVYSGRDLASYGNLVILRHKDNFLTAYSKVSDIFVKENQVVKGGELIAVVGDKQNENTELHFEIRRNGEPVNPIDYLPTL